MAVAITCEAQVPADDFFAIVAAAKTTENARADLRLTFEMQRSGAYQSPSREVNMVVTELDRMMRTHMMRTHIMRGGQLIQKPQ